MDILAKIAESKILEAIQNGEFENLPGKGKPLELEDLSHIPEELRASYRILKNAGILPEEMQLQKEIVSLQSLINCCYEEEEIATLKKKLNEKVLRFNLLMEKRKGISPSTLSFYRTKIYRRFGF